MVVRVGYPLSRIPSVGVRSPDETTKLIAALNDKLATDDRVAVVQLTVRDGVTLVRRR